MFKKSFVSIMLLISFVTFSCSKKSPDTKSDKPSPKTVKGDDAKKDGKPTLTLFVMSQCPYGLAAESAVKMISDLVGKHFHTRLEYVVNETPDGKIESLHGQPEIDGNIAQLCVQKIAPEKIWAFLECQNADPRNVDKNWQQCAPTAGVDLAKLTACKNGKEGMDMLRASAKIAAAKKVEASPTIFINDKKVEGPSPWAIMKSVCSAIKDKPAECNPVKGVAVTLLTDKRCEKCKQYEKVLDFIKRDLNEPVTKVVDYSTPEGKELYKKAGTKLVPVLFFGKSIKEDKLTFKLFEKALKPAGDLYTFGVFQPIFDPTAEICDNKTDDDGNGKTDCDDEACAKQLICAKETPGTLDVFVMSQCPYGALALISMVEVLNAFKGEMKFTVNYIVDHQNGKFRSLHGQPEVDENIRQLCAIKNYGKDYKYMEYLACRSKDYNNANWKACAVKGIDPVVMEKCIKDEGTKLLVENSEKAKTFEVQGSPTWIANGKFKFQGITAEHVRVGYCKSNPKAKGCAKPLSSNENVKAGGGCGK
ncbi:thioredoxin domain-containing protein [Myxococcota bacterium]|nr:thioredoxin domain-containing protein [Myxococcota bacterium]MBU1381072.1 thioredoxin domain-containing protein [Myxococcota bacterium]MBU1496318.1 thioredoxin domain-containing protein [Myxococcota bacterium]